MKGNMNGILRCVDQLVEDNAGLIPFAERVRQYAQMFDDEGILTYLDAA